VLNAGLTHSDETRDSVTVAASPSQTGRDRSATRLRWWASLLGVFGTVLALSIPFLPVDQVITTLKWPTAEGTKAVSAPLVSYSPVWLDASVPCTTARSLQRRSDGPGILLSTNPPTSEYGKLTALVLQVNNGQLTLFSRGLQLGSAALPVGDCTIAVHSDASRTTAQIDGQQWASASGDQRPQLTGIYSAIDGTIDPVHGLSFQARVDNRFESQATPLKLAVIFLTLAAFAGCVVVLRRLDTLAGRRPPLLVPPRWWKPTLRDGAVFSALVIWWLIGSMTSDDGYILTIARARDTAGYISNYYRWFANPEAPWGWFYEVYAVWVRVSTATPWLRLPALLMGIVCWLLISREVLPRLGQKVRRSHAAGWAAAAVFLAFWLPFNNGLRPEPVVVLFSLLAQCAVERALATKRLLPAAVGLVGAALAVGANPHGLVAVLPYVAALKPLVRLVRQRARQFGWVPVLAPISACGFVILTAVFSDQTWQAVADATKFRTMIGPSDHWYQEINRYNSLFSQTPDGSLARRFPVLLVILCLVTCMMVLLRRGRIRGAALGPSRRLLAITALYFVVLALTPTKWTHHFGIFAAVGGALAAVTALATSSTVLRSKRNRAGFFAGLMVICAFAATGPNGFWYVSGWGVPWFDKPPSINGHKASTLFLVIAAVAGVIAVIEHLRLDEHHPKVIDERQLEHQGRALRLGTAPLSIICALLIVGELATFGKVIQKQWGSYSLGADNVKQLLGSSCGLSDYVYVEADPLAGVLTPSSGQPAVAAPGGMSLPPRLEGKETTSGYLRQEVTGSFRRVGPAEAASSSQGSAQGTDASVERPDAKPPHGLGTDGAPVWGSWDSVGLGTGELRTPWYDLPARAMSGQSPLVVSVAGSTLDGNTLVAEYGKDTPQGFDVLARQAIPPGATPSTLAWRDTRVTVPPEAKGAQKVRLVAVDNALGGDGWLAISAPRVPQLVTLTQYVGKSSTFTEWPAALVHPCLQIPSISHGVAEVPKFRIAGGAEVRDVGQSWSGPDAGGPFGWMDVTTSMRELPTYVEGDVQRDWGSLYEVDPYDADALPAQAAMEVHTETHWGTWSEGALSRKLHLPGVPSSDDRNDIHVTTNNNNGNNDGNNNGNQ
jgi:arabinosyltransferase C